MPFTDVDGVDRGRVKLFALSTCIWCRKTRALLDELGVAYSFIYVDKLSSEERPAVVDELRAYNSRMNFPTVVIGEDVVITGHSPDELRKHLEDGVSNG